MNRVEKFRQIRQVRRKCTVMLMISTIIIILGVGVSDYSINELMNKKQGLSIVSYGIYNEDYYQLRIFNSNFYVNIKYIKSDMDKLKFNVDKVKTSILNIKNFIPGQ